MKTRTSSSFTTEDQHGYNQLERLVAQRGSSVKAPLFTTDVDPDKLWQAYLGGIPAERRQHYTCNCCRRFIMRFGGLVTIPDGTSKAESYTTKPVFWTNNQGNDTEPPFFCTALDAMWDVTRKAKVNGVFVSSKDVWGEPQTGQWSHLHCLPPKQLIWKHPLLTDSQKIAELREDHGVLCRSLSEYGTEAAFQAVRVIEADVVNRSEKALGVAKWFLELHQRKDAVKNNQHRHNLIWLATATAPPGWCHVKNTMIGTLLDDVIAGLPFEEIRRKWNSKIHPLQYQRPTTLSEGNVRQANAVIAKMDAEGSLSRRFATIEDVIRCCGVTIAKGGKPLGWTDGNVHLSLWLPMADEDQSTTFKGDPTGGAFDHLLMRTKSRRGTVKPVELPAIPIGWDHFNATVMPVARRIELLVPPGRSSFYALVTAVNADAPPMLQWDGLTRGNHVLYETGDPDAPDSIKDRNGDVALGLCQFCNKGERELEEPCPLPRNPVSWYFYHGGRLAHQFNLATGTWVNVDAVFVKPPHWQRPERFKHHAQEVFFALDGCRDVGHVSGGGMFPENLRTEYHGVRKAIEAYYQSRGLAGRDEGNVNGLALSGGPFQVKVTAIDGSVRQYVLSK